MKQSFFPICVSYRWVTPKTLICGAMLLCVLGLALQQSFAQESAESAGELEDIEQEIHNLEALPSPPSTLRAAPGQAQPLRGSGIAGEVVSPGLPAEKENAGKGGKKWWPFGKKEAPVSEEKIVEVGPRVAPASPNPLFRLPAAVRTGTGDVVYPGIFLIRTRTVSDEERELTVFQGKSILFTVVVRALSHQPLEPVEALNPKQPVIVKQEAKATVSEDGESLIIDFWDGKQRFQSDPLPTASDTRPQLGF